MRSDASSCWLLLSPCRTMARELLADEAAAVGVPLQDLYLHLHPVQDLGQIEGDLAAAHDEDAVDLGGVPPQGAEELVQAVGAAHQIELVPRPGHEGAVGDDHSVVPLGGAEQEGQLFHPVGQVLQGLAHQEVPLLQAEAHQLHPAPAEAVDVGRRGEAEQAGDLRGGGAFRVDDQVDAQVLLQAAQAVGILRVPDAGNGVARAHVFGDEAADHVDLVGVGGRHQHIGGVGPGLPQAGGGHAAAPDGHQVQGLGHPLQGLLLPVQYRDIMLFLDQLLGQGEADLAAADNDDLQENTCFQ